MNQININFKSLTSSWGTDAFAARLINDIMALPAYVVPLQKGLTQGDMAAERPEKVVIMRSETTETQLIIKLGVFFIEIVTGCSCADDPVTLNGYCEMQLTINKLTGDAEFQVTE